MKSKRLASPRKCQKTVSNSSAIAYLEESLNPPHLEDSLADQDNQLEETPIFDSGICAFSGVSVCPFTNYDISLFILDLSD